MSDSTADAELRLARPGEPPAELTDTMAVPPAPPTGPPAPPAAPPVPRTAPPVHGARLPWAVAAAAMVVALASVGVAVVGRSGEVGAATRERGFRSPEQAVDWFVTGVAAGDLARATDAFTVTSAVDGFSFRASSELLGSVSPVTWLPEEPEYRVVNEGRRRGDVAFQLETFIEHLAAPHRDFDVMQELSTDLTAADLEADLAPERLSGLSVIRVDDVIGPDGQAPGPFGAGRAGGYGADEFREVAVLYDTANGLALGGMQLLRFGDEWLVWDLESEILGLRSGHLEPTSELMYMALLSQVQS